MAQDLCKYYKKQRFVSYNDGLTWQPLEEYEKGELYETHSASCGAGVFQYRWVLVDNGYICDGKNRYTREVYQYSEDGTVWYNVWPTIYRKGTLVETNSPFCDNAGNGQYESGDTEPITGDTPCPPNYIWRNNECICRGYFVNGECTPCPNLSTWDGSTTGGCVCVYGGTFPNCERPVEPGGGHGHYNWHGPDPLKIVKCSNSDGVLRQEDVNYYENGWVVISYVVGDCIYRIHNSAFNGQIKMSSITISDTVEEIGILAFGHCRSLKSINFPSDITVLGSNAFFECTEIENIVFNGSIPQNIENATFGNCEKLQSATWLQYNNIVTLGNKAFYNCYSLNNVVLPESLTTIGDETFFSNRSLSNITIPSGVTSIGTSAFENCSDMTFVNINSNNINIGNNAFANCTSLTAVTINSSGVTIGNNVFSGCTRLLKLTFTATEPFEISQDEFDNTNNCMLYVPCQSEQAYKTAWSQYADRISCNDTGVYYRWVLAEGTYCDGYDEYTREKKQSTTNGITWTDTGDYRLKDLITHYSENCGYSDDVALTVTHSDGITRYYEACNEQPIPDVNKLVANYSDSTTYTLACNGDSDLSENEVRDFTTSYSSMTSAVVGNCVTYIGRYAFWGCSSLLTATLPSTIGYIDYAAFEGCNNMIKLTINAEYPPEFYPSSLYSTLPNNGCPIYVPCASVDAYKEAWSDYADRIRCNDEGLSYRWIDDGTICVNNELFFKQKQQISWDNEQNWHDTGEIRTTGSTLGECAKLYATFESSDPYIINCTSLGSIKQSEVRGTDYENIKSITLGGCVTSIDNSTFNRCINMTSIVIPNGVTSIGDSAFRECSSLTSVTIPDSVTSLARRAFIACGSLTSVRIGSGITSWGDAVFTGCTNISEVTINSGATIIGNSAFTYTNIYDIAIPNTVTSIGSDAFRGCHNLTSINIPDSVTRISVNAFNNCSNVTTVTIGSGITSIGYQAFYNCTSLTSITINATTPPTLGDSGVFDNTNNCPIYVPSASVETYKAASRWSTYASRIQAIPN